MGRGGDRHQQHSRGECHRIRHRQGAGGVTAASRKTPRFPVTSKRPPQNPHSHAGMPSASTQPTVRYISKTDTTAHT